MKKQIKTIGKDEIILIEEHLEETPEQIKEHDLFMDEMFKSVKIGNTFQRDIENALLNNSKDDFNKAYNEYKEYLGRDKPNREKSDERDINITLIQYITCAVIENLYKKDFKDNCGLEYYDVLSDAIAPRILAFTFWVAGKKNSATQILENYRSEITNKQYDDFYEILKFKHNLRDQPFDHKEKEDLYNQRKEEFLFVQDKLKLVKELSKMPTSNDKKKKQTKL